MTVHSTVRCLYIYAKNVNVTIPLCKPIHYGERHSARVLHKRRRLVGQIKRVIIFVFIKRIYVCICKHGISFTSLGPPQ